MNSGFIVVVFLLSHVRLFCDPMDCGLHRVLCPWDFPGKSTEWVTRPSSRGSSRSRSGTLVSCIGRRTLYLSFIKNIIYSLSPGRPMLYSRFSLVTYFIHRINNVICLYIYMSVLISQFILPPRFSSWCPYVCSLLPCLYFSSINKTIYTNFFRYHIYALIYDICFSLVLWERRGVGSNLSSAVE